MGHLNMSDVRKVVKELGIEEAPHPYQQLEDEDPFWCECCILGKMTRKPNREPATRRATRPMEFLHIDVVGPWETASLSRRFRGKIDGLPASSQYCTVIVDDYTGHIWTRFSAGRAGFRERLVRFIDAECDLTNGHVVKRIKIDRALEFVKEEVKQYCGLNGIELGYSSFYDYEQNGRAERVNRTL